MEPVLSTLQRKPLSDQIAEILTDDIIGGVYSIGDKLPNEGILCDQYGVSRTVIREAMNKLKQKGLVESKVAKGTFVISNLEKGLSDSIDMLLQSGTNVCFNELLELRSCIEPGFTALAAERITEDMLREMQDIINRMTACLQRYEESHSESEQQQFSELDSGFHRLIQNACRNGMIESLMTPIFNQIQKQQIRHYKMKTDAMNQSLRYHQQIYEALSSHDSDKARELMKCHIQSVCDDFSEQNSDKVNQKGNHR